MKKLISILNHRRAVYTLPWFAVFLLCLSCGSGDSNSKAFGPFDPNKDYFPEKVAIDYAIGFDVQYHGHWKELQLFRHYNDFVDTIVYALVQRGTPAPAGFAANRTLEVPVQQLGSLSTTHLAMFEVLDALDHLKGVETAQYVSSNTIQQLVSKGEAIELAPSGMLNTEIVLASGIQALLGVGYPNSQNDNYQVLESAGIPVLLNADWQEKDLLGRAEWLKLVAVLLNKEKEANAYFEEIVKEYQRVLNLVENEVEKSPLTITGIANGDAWYVAGGNSFTYRMLQTAKVAYPWSNNESTGSIKLDFETVYAYGLKADYWMVPSNAKTLGEVLQRDSRYADFKAFKTGKVYNVYGKYTEGGGNDYYESGIVQPHVILKDIVKIFHPQLLPNHELVYYAPLR